MQIDGEIVETVADFIFGGLHHQYSFSTPLPKMDFLLAQFTRPEEQQGEGEGREEESEEEEEEKGDEGKEEEGRLEWCGRGNGKVV